MDSLTQGLLGAVTSQLGFRQRIGRDAGWVAAAVAVTPDLDVLVGPLLSLSGAEAGEMAVTTYHRGLSHSLLMTPLIAAVGAGIWWWARRRAGNRRRSAQPDGAAEAPAGRPPPFSLLYACCFVAALSHPLLDWCTSYGTQLLAPITKTRFAIDAMPIIDIFYTPMLIVTLLACYLLRKLKANPRRATLIAGWVGFALSTGYIIAGVGLNWSLRASAAGALGNCRTRAYPQLLTIFVWRVTAEDEQAWYVARHNVLFSPPLTAESFTRAAKVDNQWVRRARRLAEVKTYRWFCSGQMREAYARSDGLHVVTFHDMRYGASLESPQSMWPLRVSFDRHGSVVDVSRRHRYRRGDFGKLARRLWRDNWSP